MKPESVLYGNSFSNGGAWLEKREWNSKELCITSSCGVINGRKIFRGERDQLSYLQRVEHYRKRYGFIHYAYKLESRLRPGRQPDCSQRRKPISCKHTFSD